VIDHLSNPNRPLRREPWASLLAQAAEFPNVYAKVSGSTQEATTRAGGLSKTYAPSCTTPSSCSAPSVLCSAAIGHLRGRRWLRAVVGALFDIFEDFAGPERAALLGGTASSVYAWGAGAMIDLFGRFPGLPDPRSA